MSGSAASTAAQTQIELHLTCNDVAFDFTCYRPALCAQVREHSGISEAEYLAAFAHAPGRANLLSGGRSGSIVARSHDGKVVFKTMKNEELVILLRILDVYVAHLATFPCSMLSRYLGLYRVKRGNTSFTFMAMANVLDRGVEIHEIYDLKGSSHGRQSFARTETRSGVGKDLDLNRRIRMEREAMSEIHSQISADVGFLHELQLMDYSMLLGVHVCDEAKCHHDFSEYENTLRSIYKRGAQGYGTDRERFIYVFGIIDLLQDWNLNKRMEQFVKTSLFGHSCESVSAVEPDTYAVRFKEALSTFLR